MIITLHCYRSRFSFVDMGIIPTPVIMRGNISRVNRIYEKINKMRFLTSIIDKNQSTTQVITVIYFQLLTQQQPQILVIEHRHISR